MKKEIHPKYENVTIKCACGNEFETRSTVGGEMHVELCSVCHPFFTGKQKFIDTAGRVDKFQARIKAAQSKKTEKSKSTEKKTTEKSNSEKLAEIKAEVTATKAEPKPMNVTQEASSDVELAAEAELAEAKDNK